MVGTCRRYSRPAMRCSTSAVFAGRPRPASRCLTRLWPACPAGGTIRLLDKRDVARKSMFTTHSLPLSILIEEIEQSCDDIFFIGIQPGDTEFYNPMSPEVFDAVDAVYDAVAANDFSHFVRLGQEL
ncbi:MAG: hypothetical protein SPF97_06930 [Collinsella sp.]|nr:hypothetical protein [Collinsella sp.]